MALLKINSGLAHFKMVARIVAVTPVCIQARACLDGLPGFTVMEAMAQVAALHARYRMDFARHAFLLKVQEGRLPGGAPLRGGVEVTADLAGHSSSGFVYAVRARGDAGSTLAAELMIGTCPYDQAFQEVLLKAHYRDLFATLSGGGKVEADESPSK